MSIQEKAFPNPHLTNETGMTMRDYFAAKAMQGFLTGDYDLYPHEAAQKAYAIADEMMEARK
jgi:hypothetical protein